MNKVHVILFISFLLFLLVAEGLAGKKKNKAKGGAKAGAGLGAAGGKGKKNKGKVGGAVGGKKNKGGKLGGGKKNKGAAAAAGKKNKGAAAAAGKKNKKNKAPGGVEGKVPTAGPAKNPDNLPEVIIDKDDATLVYVVGKDTYKLPWTPMEPVSAIQILNTHNVFRKLLGIPGLRWSYQLEQSAWFWVRNCIPAHDPNLEYPLGENMASLTSTEVKLTDELNKKSPGELEVGAAQQWLSEISSYDCRRNECRSNPETEREKVCGHFVQAAWNGTTHVGCAVINCNQNSPFGGFVKKVKNDYWKQISCRYYPPAWEFERPFEQKKCGSIETLSLAGKIPGLERISTGFGPLGLAPGLGNADSSKAVSTGAARVIPKFGVEVPV